MKIGQKIETRLKEHKKYVENNTKTQFTRSERKSSITSYNKSAITDHVNQKNHVIDWEGTQTVDREGDTRTRQVNEAIHIRRHTSTMNRDNGAYQLPRAYDPIFAAHSCSGGKGRSYRK